MIYFRVDSDLVVPVLTRNEALKRHNHMSICFVLIMYLIYVGLGSSTWRAR